MRTFDELLLAALRLRARLLLEDKPLNGVFHVTWEEALTLGGCTTFCDFTLRVI